MDFHPVILAGGRGSRMYPLTEECPKALLPVGNKPLIWYPVQLLERNGFEEAVVVVRESHQRAISDVLTLFQVSDGVHLKFTLAPISDQEDMGTADALRAVRHKIKSDVLLLSCDLVTSVNLHLLTDFHCTHGCTLTALLVQPPKGEEPRKKAVVNQRDIVGLAEHSKLVYFSAEADLDEHLVVSQSMLRRYPHIRVCSQLLDAHLYILQRWVLDYLAENKSISSVKGELVPQLVKHQSLQGGVNYTSANREAMKSAAKASLNDMEQLAYQMSSYAGLKSEVDSRLVSCHAVVVEDKLCTRINTVPAYMDINRLLPNYLNEFGLERPLSGTTHTRVKGVSPDSMVDNGVQLGEKGSVKRSCIAQHCTIGAKTKILNSIIMDHVHIGEGCSLQGCIVCSHARIEDKVSLKDCQVGANFTVTREADLRGETLVTGGGMLF